MNKKDYNGSTKLFLKLIDKYPKSKWIRDSLRRNYINFTKISYSNQVMVERKDAYTKAMEIYKRICKEYPTEKDLKGFGKSVAIFSMISFLKGVITGEEADSVINGLEIYTIEDPGFKADIALLRVGLLGYKKKHEEAMQLLENTLLEYPNREDILVDGHKNAQGTYQRLNKPFEALKHTKCLIEYYSKHPNAEKGYENMYANMNLAGNLYFRLNDFISARNYWEEVIKQGPKSESAALAKIKLQNLNNREFKLSNSNAKPK